MKDTVNYILGDKADSAIHIILKKNLAVKKKEKLLVVYDSSKKKIADRFINIIEERELNYDFFEIKISKVNGEEPEKKFLETLLKSDAAIFLTDKSLSHTVARRAATEKGIRIASMPGINECILRRSIDIDYKRLKEEIKQVGRLLSRAKKVNVKTEIGTDMEFSLYNRKAHGFSAGIFSRKGSWGNLPEGEAFIAPVEGTAKGVFVVDGSIAGFGKIRHPLIFIVENGFVIKVTDGKKPPLIENLLNRYGKSARNIAEFGIGLNRKAKVTGIVLEDEKAYGTCHFALGNNCGFGGLVDVPLHIDCVILKPDIYLDGKRIMKRGKLAPL